MPIFDYLCTDCKTQYDVFHKGREITEDNVCPSCHSQRYQRLISAPNISVSTATSNNPSRNECETPGNSCCGGMICGQN